LMFDEIQCGMGRLGQWCGWKTVAPEVVPDAISWAKGIGGGFPLGATWIRRKAVRKADGSALDLCDLLQPGSHGTTYGGTPLACSVSLAVLNTIAEEGLLQNAATLGDYILDRLGSVSGVKEVRGRGLMLGIELDDHVSARASDEKTAAQAVVTQLLAGGLLAAPAGPSVVRWLPPLIVTRAEVDEAIAILTRTLR
jgi:acetylornithine/N-succinyldiaminopimelate aminotransferase